MTDTEIKNTESEEVTNISLDPNLAASDEDFEKQVAPPAVTEKSEAVVEKPASEVEEEETDPQANTEDEEGKPNKEGDLAEEEVSPAKPTPTKEEPKPNTDEDNADPLKAKAKAEEEAEPVNYEEAYNKLMAPFKANGKEIKLNSPDELIKLAQMGANYTKKMQALQPNLKIMKMLENHGLTDERQLSYLIDLHKKDPAAIQKLIKDSGIDPLDIDSEGKETYKANNYAVPDEEVLFSSAVEELKEVAEGQEILNEVGKQNGYWDKASKDAIWKQPDILRHMTAQKQNGIYQTIVSEIDRRKILGQLPNVPFVEAYFTVGTELNNAGKLNPVQTKEPEVVGKSVKVPADKVNNDAAAKAAAPTRVNPTKTVKENFNPLSMSDDDFMKSELAQRV